MKTEAPRRKMPGWPAMIATAIALFVLGWVLSALVQRIDEPRAATTSNVASTPIEPGPVDPQRPGQTPPSIVAAAPPGGPQLAAPVATDGGVAPVKEELSPAEQEARLEDVRKQARDQIVSGLEGIRSAALSSCWPGAPGGAAQLGLTYAVTFDKNGNETSRAIQEAESTVAPDIRNCLRDYYVPAFHIAPTGMRVSVDAFMSYP